MEFWGRKLALLIVLLGLSAALCTKGAEPSISSSTESRHETRPPLSFQDKDVRMMADLNSIFYPAPIAGKTVSRHHGGPTDNVYVFLHGMFRDGSDFTEAANRKFAEGANVIVGTLPGHEKKGSLSAAENSAGVWLEYVDYLGTVARRYGKKVIFVGKSTSANLAVRAAENGKADELVLIQPLFSLNTYLKNGAWVGRLLIGKKLEKQRKSPCVVSEILGRDQADIEDILNAFDQAEILSRLEYRAIKSTVPVHIYVADKDPVVSRKYKDWVDTYAPHAQITHNKNPWNHFYDPL